MDFLDTSVMTFADPPELATPANPLPELLRGYQGQPVPPSPRPPRPRAPAAEPPRRGPAPAPPTGVFAHPSGRRIR